MELNFNHLFVYFIILRVLMAFLSQTWHVPDETWQSVEVAHRLIYRHGFLTWEWFSKTPFRSHIHPLLFIPATLFSPNCLMWVSPRITQAIITALGDVAIVSCIWKKRKVSKKFLNVFLVLYSTNWYLLYCGSRTLINTLEMTLSNIALFFLHEPTLAHLSCVILALGVIIRPTLIIMWSPLLVHHFAKYFDGLGVKQRYQDRLLKTIVMTLSVIIIATLLESWLYGFFVFLPWNFFLNNVLQGVGTYYGVQPWYWYFSVALPSFFLLFGLAPIIHTLYVVCMKPSVGQNGSLAFSTLFNILVFSLIAHKEMRFLLPVLPIFVFFQTDGIILALRCSWISIRNMNRFLLVWAFCNIVLALYLSLIHQIGVMNVFRSGPLSHEDQPKSILFLMPCHSTPAYSHVSNSKLRFLSCESSDDDEAATFYTDPTNWLVREFDAENFTHVVCFDVLTEEIHPFLLANSYRKCAKFFHTHFPEGRVGSYVHLYCKYNGISTSVI